MNKAKEIKEIDIEVGSSLWRDAYKRLRKNKMASVCGAVIVLITALSFLGPFVVHYIWGYDYASQDLNYGAQPPSLIHWFGTDFFGRDLLTRVMYGGQISLMVGILAALVSAVVGTLFGAVSGYFGGKLDALMMRIVDIIYALPYMFLVIIFVSTRPDGARGGLLILFVALGFVGWLTTARIVRGQILALKQQEFVLAAKSCGAGHTRIIFQHLLPNTLGPIIVYFTLSVPSMILQEAFLSFLGLGVQAPRPSLGALINAGASHMSIFWWELLFPGCAMALLLFCLNFFGDGVRDALDPRMRT